MMCQKDGDNFNNCYGDSSLLFHNGANADDIGNMNSINMALISKDKRKRILSSNMESSKFNSHFGD